jgi:hypothetical protein
MTSVLTIGIALSLTASAQASQARSQMTRRARGNVGPFHVKESLTGNQAAACRSNEGRHNPILVNRFLDLRA